MLVKTIKQDRGGTLLIESMVAISVGVVGILGILALLSRSLGLHKEVGQKFIATYLAAEGIEVVKSLIDKNYVEGRAWNSDLADGIYRVEYKSTALATTTPPLLFSQVEGTYGYDSGRTTPFIRVVTIKNIDRDGDGGADEIKVKAKVEWRRRGGGIETVELEDHFFNWR